MSTTPKGVIASVLPTATGPCPPKLLRAMRSPAPRGRPAAAHQCSRVGRLFPANSANAAASYQLTPLTGKSAFPSGKSPASHVAGPGRPVRSTKACMASAQERVRPSLVNSCFQYRWSR